MPLSSVQNPHSELVGALYRDHRGWLLAWLRRNVACPQRAEDLSQDTFVRLLGRADLKAPREPRAFLAAIAKGLLFDYFRRAALEQAYLNELMLIPEAWEKNTLLDPKLRSFYQYSACLMEPWDGPAAVTFTDGSSIGAVAASSRTIAAVPSRSVTGRPPRASAA